jgi:hypothetical protein
MDYESSSLNLSLSNEPDSKKEGNSGNDPFLLMKEVVLEPNYTKKIRFVCISDTHNKHSSTVLPEGDVLIHAGDSSNRGEESEIELFREYLNSEPLRKFKHKIFISGNHELSFPAKGKEEIERIFAGSTYLEDSGVDIEGIKIWGTPWTGIKMAFHCNPQSEGKVI